MGTRDTPWVQPLTQDLPLRRTQTTGQRHLNDRLSEQAVLKLRGEDGSLLGITPWDVSCY